MRSAAAEYPPSSGEKQVPVLSTKERVTLGELRAVVIVALAILAVSCLPYLIGYMATPPDRVFGGFLLDELDANED